MEGGQELSPYLQWQKDMREQDLQEELARIDRRHLEGLIGHDEAAAARERLIERNREAARLTKEEVCHQPAQADFRVCGAQTLSQPPSSSHVLERIHNEAWMCCFCYRQLN